MNNPKILSPAMLKTYQQCRKKFFLRYVRNILMPQSAAQFERGKNIHAIAGYFLAGIDISRFELSLNDTEKLLWNKLKSNQYFQLTPVKTEFTLNVKLGSYWFGGRLDAIVKKNETEYFILDYKTGSAPDDAKYDYQTMVYISALSKYLKITEGLNFVYIDLKNNQNILIKSDEQLIAEYETRLIKTAEQIASLNENSLTKCKDNKKCEYSKICF